MTDDLYALQADLYDALYTNMKDYHQEAADFLSVITERLGKTPDSLLDVACGTGLHLQSFQHSVNDVVGIDLSESQLTYARERLDGIALHQGDMRCFDLNQRFDAITCLFSSIGHLQTDEDYVYALESMARHLNSNGVVVVEPWVATEDFTAGRINVDEASNDSQHAVRVSYGSVVDDTAYLNMHWTVSTDGSVRTWDEVIPVRLRSVDEQITLFKSVFAEVEYLDEPIGAKRGLFIAQRPLSDTDVFEQESKIE